MPGFASTAAYFEARAGKERDPHEREFLQEVAGFYRRLAGIAPDFPAGYKSKSHYGYANQWRARAEECRAMADHFTDPTCRAQMARLADSYDRMAVAAE